MKHPGNSLNELRKELYKEYLKKESIFNDFKKRILLIFN